MKEDTLSEREQLSRTARIYQRVVVVYDVLLPGGKIYRWDTEKEDRNFAVVNHCHKVKVNKIAKKYSVESASLVNRTTPNALVRMRSNRKRIKGSAHPVSKE